MRLVAVRHGQASYGSDDYDRLSERGWQQARRLGDWLAGHGEAFAHVVCGDMRRHRETWQAIADAYRARELALPTPQSDPACNEFDHQAVISGFVTEQPEHPAVLAHRRDSANLQTVAALLRAAFGCWAAGTLRECGEPWPSFRQRTREAGRRLHRMSRDGAVLLLTSGGVMAQLAAEALDAPDERAVELNLALRNSALAEFHALPDGLRLLSWNGLPHLADARELWTYF